MSFALPRGLAVAMALLLAQAGAWAQAGVSAAPQNVLSLSASASVEVTQDVLTVTLAATQEGADAGAVQAQLTRSLDAALAAARKAAVPGQLDVSTGNFSLFPRYSPKPGPLQWQGRAELRLSGRDSQAIAELTARITSMTVANVQYSLSREAREKVQAEVSAQAIQNFRAKAQSHARQFGFSGYDLREVQVNSDESQPRPPPMMVRASASPVAMEAALPIEAGRASVNVTVSGSVQMH